MPMSIFDVIKIRGYPIAIGKLSNIKEPFLVGQVIEGL